jgi:hypothetical protein
MSRVGKVLADFEERKKVAWLNGQKKKTMPLTM